MKNTKSQKQQELDDLIIKNFLKTDNAPSFKTNKSSADLTTNLLKFVYFKLSNEYYAIDILKVLEVIRMTRISFLPSDNPYILGIINMRGNIVPVIDTHSLFNVNNLVKDNNLSYIMIIEVGRTLLGFIIDSVSHVVEILENQIEQPMVTLEHKKTEHIIGETSVNNQLVALLDIEKLVNNEIFKPE